MEKVVVLFSGGQDSTVCLLMAIEKYTKENVEAISFIYNNEYRKDIDCAVRICKKLNVKHTIYDAGVLHNIANNNNVEGRNLVLMSLSAIYAQVHNITNIMVGVALDDIKCDCPHPDCSVEFIESLQETIMKASGCGINIIAPLVNLKKVDIWRLADELGYLEFVKKETFSCYISEEKHCKNCISCKLRFESLEDYMRLKMMNNNINIID
jgi:7-cyano-7-deazaguanine synthase